MTVVKLMTADHDDWEPGHKSGISASSTIFYLSHRWGDIKSVLSYIESHTDERSYRTDYSTEPGALAIIYWTNNTVQYNL